MNMFRDGLFAGKRILVTGGGTGLGEVMAEAYAKLGAAVYICGRRASVVEGDRERISAETGSQVKGVACDIRGPEAVDEMISQIWSDGGALTGPCQQRGGQFHQSDERPQSARLQCHLRYRLPAAPSM